MRIACISDTHNKHGQIHPYMPKADVLIHSGDFCGYGNLLELKIFSMWLDLLPYKYKIIVAGNHDKSLQQTPKEAEKILKSGQYFIGLPSELY